MRLNYVISSVYNFISVINRSEVAVSSCVIAVLNINNPGSAMVLSLEGKMLETNMEPIEQTFVMRIWEKNSSLMEDDDA